MSAPIARLITRHLRQGLGASVLVAALVAITVFAAALVPRVFAAVATAELHHELSVVPSEQVNLRGDGRIGLPGLGSDATVADLLGPTDEAIAAIPSTQRAPLGDGLGEPRWLLRTVGALGSNPDNEFIVLSLRLAIDLDWLDHITFVEGSPPEAWPGEPRQGEAPPVPIALSEDIAHAMDVGAGDVIETGNGPLLVAGVYALTDPEESYWRHASDLASPLEIRESGQRPKVQASAFVDPGTILALRDPFVEGTLAAWVPVDPEAYEYADLDTLITQAGNLTVTPRALPEFGQVTFGTSLPDLFERTRAAVASTESLIALAASGLIGVLVATYALSIQALVRRRRSALSLLAARGASLGQLRALTVLEAAVLALPGSAIAIGAAAVLVPARLGPEGWIAPIVLAATPVALAALLVDAGSLREGRQDVAVRSRSRLRWVLEVAVAAAALVALYLLQQRGLVASSEIVGIDPLLAATPLLVAATLGLLALRLVPLPLRLVRAAGRRRPAPVWEVGSARAIREPAIGAIASLALVIGVTIVVFSTVMISTVAVAMDRAAREAVGADLQLTAHDLPSTLVDDLRGLSGVDAATALVTRSGLELEDDAGRIRLTAVLADPAELALVRPDLPVVPDAGGGAVPVLLSQRLADQVQGSSFTVEGTPITVAGIIPDGALPGLAGLWLIADHDAAGGFGLAGQVPSRVLVALADENDGATVDAIRDLTLAAQPPQFAATVRVFDVQSSLAATRSAPITAALEGSLLLVSTASLLLTMLVVALTAAASAAARNRVVGVLRILGMDARQVRALVAWEFAPVAIASVLVGTLVGLALPFVVTAVLDLRAFFGGSAAVLPSVEPAWVAAAVGGYAVAIAAAVVVASALGRRFAPASTLKMGDL